MKHFVLLFYVPLFIYFLWSLVVLAIAMWRMSLAPPSIATAAVTAASGGEAGRGGSGGGGGGAGGGRKHGSKYGQLNPRFVFRLINFTLVFLTCWFWGSFMRVTTLMGCWLNDEPPTWLVFVSTFYLGAGGFLNFLVWGAPIFAKRRALRAASPRLASVRIRGGDIGGAVAAPVATTRGPHKRSSAVRAMPPRQETLPPGHSDGGHDNACESVREEKAEPANVAAVDDNGDHCDDSGDHSNERGDDCISVDGRLSDADHNATSRGYGDGSHTASPKGVEKREMLGVIENPLQESSSSSAPPQDSRRANELS